MTSTSNIHVVSPGVAIGPAGTPAEDLSAAIDSNRPGCGRLNGIDAPIGTILGPDHSGQPFTVISRDERGVRVDRATVHDRHSALTRVPQSLAEIGLQRQAGLMP